MNQLIKIETKTIGNDEVNAINARELHAFLEVGKDFSNWIKGRIEQYDFIQGIDFTVFANSGENLLGGRPKQDYIISIDMAKELSMVERNEKGKQARKYFIECERIAKEKSKPKTSFDLSLSKMPEVTNAFMAMKILAEAMGFDENQRLFSANNAIKRISGVDCMDLVGFKQIEYKPNIQYHTPTVLGDMSGVTAAKMNRILAEKGLQKETRDYKNRLVWVVTEKGKQYSRLFDTGKLHSSGQPVQQIKWSEAVILL